MTTLLRAEAVAARANMCVRTLHRRMRDAHGPKSVKLGRLTFFNEAEVDAWLARGSQAD